MKLGLAAIDEVCERLGRPERRVASVLIAGTNGKGSTAATLSSVARASGVRAGLYTSPHLIRVTERFRIEDEDVEEEELDQTLARVFEAADRSPQVPVTYFEALTAAAFLLFADRRLELAILEVGLGGRFDATNVAPARLSVITSVSLDHTEELGPSIASIAREKAGVFRGTRPALVGSPLDEARRVFREVAREVGATLHEMSEEATLEVESPSPLGTRFHLRTPERDYELCTPLAGRHQASNTATAVRAAELLWPDFRFDVDAIARGVGSVRWPGRLERFSVRGRSVWLDGCHNPDGAASLAAFLSEMGLEADLVFGAMADKDIEAMASVLGGTVNEIRLVPLSSARAATADELRRRLAPWRSDARPSPSLDEALEELLSRPGGKPIIVAGSLYLVGEARQLLIGERLEATRP
jgi:dihydrofolate synthase / folylpolyglutamate synthase